VGARDLLDANYLVPQLQDTRSLSEAARCRSPAIEPGHVFSDILHTDPVAEPSAGSCGTSEDLLSLISAAWQLIESRLAERPGISGPTVGSVTHQPRAIGVWYRPPAGGSSEDRQKAATLRRVGHNAIEIVTPRLSGAARIAANPMDDAERLCPHRTVEGPRGM
jgi:hypothetical protein